MVASALATLAALCHDLGHTGHNNAFHVATSSDLAILYSDQSVLEMHHLASTFKLLQEKDEEEGPIVRTANGALRCANVLDKNKSRTPAPKLTSSPTLFRRSVY